MLESRIAVLLIVFACIPVAWGKEIPADPNKTDTKRFEEAYDCILDEKWGAALTAFETFIQTYEKSPYLDDAHFWHCYAMEKTGARDEGVFKCYQKLINTYPKSQWTDDAKRSLITVAKRLSDSGKTEYGAIVRAMQESENKEIALTAIMALRQIGSERALDALAGLYSSTQHRAVREEIISTISQFKSPKVIPSLTKIIKEDPDRHMREQALFWLSQKSQSKEAVKLIEHVALNDPNEEVREKAVFALSQVREGKGLGALKRIAGTAKDPAIRQNAVFWIGRKAKSTDMVQFLETVVLKDSVAEIRETALLALSQAPEGRGVEALMKIGRTAKNAGTRREAVFWLGQRARSNDVIQFLGDTVLKDTNGEVRDAALHALSQAPDGRGVEALKKIAETSKDAGMREEAVFWLSQRTMSDDVIQFLEAVVLNETVAKIREAALLALSQARDGSGVKALMKISGTAKDAETRKGAIFWLGQQARTDEVIQFLEKVVREDSDPEVRKDALTAIVHARKNIGVPALINLAKSHPDRAIRRDAIFWLGQSKDPRATEALVEIVKEMK